MLPPALAVSGLVKTFDRPVISAFDLTIPAGQFYVLLGPNGVGKTTILRMIAGLLRPDAGTISILGNDTAQDPLAARRVTAWVSDEPMVYDRLTPFEYLEFVAGLWGVDTIRARRSAGILLDQLDLIPHAGERCGGFSKGMLQKVALAGALIHDPAFIILDEPLTGLDAASARRVKDMLRHRVMAGATVLMTTHILEVAERMAERIGVLSGGKLVAEGTLADLRTQVGPGDTSLEDIFLSLTAADSRQVA